MKLSYFIFSLLITLPHCVYAQGKYKSIGIEAGLFSIDGDVDSGITDGSSISISYNQDLHSFLNLEVNYLYGKTSGLDPQIFRQNPYTDSPIFPKNQVRIHNMYVGAGLNKNIAKNTEIGLQYGLGLMAFNNRMNIFNEAGFPYPEIEEFILSGGGITLDQINEIYDDSYETQGIIDNELFNVNNYSFQLSHNVSTTIKHHLTDRWTLGLKAGILISKTDALDGITHRTFQDPTNNLDIVHRVSALMMYRIGNGG